MIWNLAQYLIIKFPAEKFYFDAKDIVGTSDKVPDRIILIQETGGIPVPIIKNVTDMIQIITRDIDIPKARDLAMLIYNDINNRFGLILPSNIVDGIMYPAIQTGQISAISKPQSLGYDEQGRAEFSTNYKVIYRETLGY